MMNFGKFAGIAGALLCSCALGAGASRPNGGQEHIPNFERSVTMQGPGCQNVKWTVDREASTITFLVESAVGADWVGLGISENGGMKGADVAIIRKTSTDSSPQIVVDDRVSVDYAVPTKDALQNVELLYSELREADQRIVAVIQRNIKTCDKDDLTVEAHKQHLICASGSTDSDNEILFHGPNHSHAFVNLVVEEELLFETPLAIENEYSSSTQLALGVNAWGDPESSVVPFPLDIQMPNVSLPSDVVTSYICTVVDIPFEARFIQAESVWGDGLTLKNVESLPSYLHHQVLYSCPEHIFQGDYDSTEPFPCLEMPSCDTVFGLARGTDIVLPSGLHMKVKAGQYILQTHYNNYQRVSINNDRSGIRLWIEPPLFPSHRTPGQLLISRAQLSSIVIPADPEEKDYNIQYMIPGDATRAYIPPEGIHAVAAGPHMHERGIRARLQLIRGGAHILDIFNTLSYDFNMQVPIYKGWKLLPGDSLLMTCTYRPHPMHIVKGGYSAESEMCTFWTSFAQEIPAGIVTGFGYAVELGQPLRKAYLGPVPVGGDAFTLDPSWATFAPQENEEHFKPIIDHRKNFCDLVVRDSLDIPAYSFAEYNITAMLTMIIAYAFCYIMASKPVSKRVFGVNWDERTKRNSIVYIGQLIYGTIGLPIVIIALVEMYSMDGTFDAVRPNTHSLARGIIVVQAILFLLELFYRISIRIEVVLHHVIAASLTAFLYYAVSQTLAAEFILKSGMVLILMALTDHPLNLALLLKNLGHAETSWWPKLCKASGVMFVLCKMVLTGMAIAVLVDGNNVNGTMWSVPNYSLSSWRNNESNIDSTAVTIFVAVLLIGLFAVQMFVGYVMWALGSKYEKKNSIDSAVPALDDEQEKIHDTLHMGTVSLSRHHSSSSV